MTKLKNSNCERKKLKNSNFDKTHKPKLRQHLKPQTVTKLENSNCDQTQKLKIVTKLKKSKGELRKAVRIAQAQKA